MIKRRYEKPEMLVETFVATQSVATTCEGILLTYKELEVTAGSHTCTHKECDKGHVASEGFVTTYDKNGDSIVSVFNSTTDCKECFFDEIANGVKEGHAIKELGQIINGNGAWASTPHPPMLDETPLPPSN